jgi:hypothetical protein
MDEFTAKWAIRGGTWSEEVCHWREEGGKAGFEEDVLSPKSLSLSLSLCFLFCHDVAALSQA